MKKFYRYDKILVYKNGELMWRVCEVYKTTTRPPWYKFWQTPKYDFTFENPEYIEIPEVKE